MSTDSKTTAPATTAPATTAPTGQAMTPGQLATVAPAMVTLTPALTRGPDGEPSWNVRSLQVPEAGQAAMTRVTAAAHGMGVTPKQAAAQGAKLYRSMLAEALLECGIDSPAVRRAAGKVAGK